MDNFIEIIGSIVVAIIPAIVTYFLQQYNYEINKYFVRKKSNFFRDGWLLYKRLYWEGDQTVDYATFVKGVTVKILLLFFGSVYISVLSSVLSDLLFYNFGKNVINKIGYMVTIFLMKVVVLLFMAIDIFGISMNSNEWRTRFGNRCLSIVKLFCDLSILYIIENDYGTSLTEMTLLVMLPFYIYIFVSGYSIFCSAQPYDTETIMKVYYNKGYLKNMSGIKKCFHTVVDKQINFFEAIIYDKEQLTLKFQTECDYSKAGEYSIVFTVIPKENPKKTIDFTSSIVVEERVKRNIDISKISKHLNMKIYVVTFALAVVLLVTFYLMG